MLAADVIVWRRKVIKVEPSEMLRRWTREGEGLMLKGGWLVGWLMISWHR